MDHRPSTARSNGFPLFWTGMRVLLAAAALPAFAQFPPATITSLVPNFATAGRSAFLLTVNGTNFCPPEGEGGNPTTTVIFAGTRLPTIFVNPTQLTAPVPANLVAVAGIARVQVDIDQQFCIQGDSNVADFPITPPPTITALVPNFASAGGPAFVLTVNGIHFLPGTTVRWDGTALATTIISPSQVTADVTAALLATLNTSATISMVSGDGVPSSNTAQFRIDGPAITVLNPASAVAGGPQFNLVVTGSAFVAGSVVRWDATPLVTQFNTAGH
jgi:hypothetical protein